ncbi:leucine-rich repeat domain-containing protein [Prevotella disiens]|uniref:leucine-rich repeat domain-containing protein n=1 Tax=Prevotella disiens TaxID=28130 RepID=UPI00216B4B60|nr:leucine-rich repeat domain-containing protein [Prevotella disiens]
MSLPAIQKIGKDAFANCHGIKTVELGSGLTSVLGNSFKSCSAMESLTMTGASAVFTVKNNAIIDANKTLVYLAGAAKSIELTESECTRIGEAAMYGNKTLTKISLPGVITVGNDAFNSCSSLSELLVPNLKEVEDTGI